ncbi:MAG: EI24 domain-containing protein [Candidatus Sericytochromatia bacterium]
MPLSSVATSQRCPDCGTPLLLGESCPYPLVKPRPSSLVLNRLLDVPWGTWQILSDGPLRTLAFWPLVLTCALLAVALWFGFGWFQTYLNTWINQTLSSGFWTSLLTVFLAVFSGVGALVLFAFFFVPVMSLVCLPFLDPLSLRVERRWIGELAATGPPWKVLLKEMLALLGVKLLLLVPGLLLLGVPIAGPLVFAILMAMTLSLDFLDLLWMRKGYRLGDKLDFLKRNQLGWIFFLLPLTLMVWVPVLQLLLIPGAAAGAVRFYLAADKRA